MKLPAFEYIKPPTLAEAVRLLAANPDDAKAIAGGQSLMPLLAYRLTAPRLLVDLGAIPDLNRIDISAQGIRLGALVRWRDILDDDRLRMAHPLLYNAVEHVAHYQIRNRGTVGGSLAHADPSAELPGIALCCDGVIHVRGERGERTIKAADFFVGPLTTSLAAGELITGLQLPHWPENRRWGFEEFARRRGDFAIAGVCAGIDTNNNSAVSGARIAVIGMGSTPQRIAAAEQLLCGRVLDAASITAAAAAAAEAVTPSADIHGSADYRRALVSTLLERVLQRCMLPADRA
ncbi:MAG: xanthine dehydrogenase family protein subunit M [Betaproteobacteria bacterium]|nr:xanthine dehydrogenase family protein subunit M [Betaproteobacteria bacterium]